MREIKFRVRNDLTKKIIGYEALFSVSIKNDDYQWAQSVNGQDWTNGIIEQLHCTREQFTGLKDRNGKEIYEGDVIHYLRKDITAFDNDYERTFVIEWREGGFWGKDSGIKIKDIADENSEVIGNIYENQELLK